MGQRGTRQPSGYLGCQSQLPFLPHPSATISRPYCLHPCPVASCPVSWSTVPVHLPSSVHLSSGCQRLFSETHTVLGVMQMQGSNPGPHHMLGQPENRSCRFSMGIDDKCSAQRKFSGNASWPCCHLLSSLLGWLSLILPSQVTHIGSMTVQGFDPNSRLIFPLTL